MAVPLTLDRRTRRARVHQDLQAAVTRCLGPRQTDWRSNAEPSTTLAGWWIVDLFREADATHVHVFVDGTKNVQAQVCRRLGEVIPEECPDTADCSQAGSGGAVRIEIDAAVPAKVAEFFAAASRIVFEQRRGSYGIRVAIGRSPEEVVLFVTGSRRALPLPLFFPRASELDLEEVKRILGNVLEGLVPCFC